MYISVFSIFLLIFIMIQFSDPSKVTSKAALLQRNQRALGTPSIQIKCKHCNLHQQMGTKHCLVCNKCIIGFDHHCVWLDLCIGKYNYKKFISFVLALIVVNGFAAFMNFREIVINHLSLVKRF